MAEQNAKTTPPTPTASPIATVSPLAQRTALIQEGKSYAEAQAAIMGGKVSVEELGGAAPEPEKKAVPKVEIVSTTSGVDKYIVKVDGVQKILGKSEIESLGGSIPVPMERENILHQVGVEQGAKARQAQETLFRQQDAARALSEAEGMSSDAALATIQRFETQPTSPEFVGATPEAVATLTGVSRISSTGLERLSRARAEQFKAENIQVGIQRTGEPPQFVSKVDYEALEKADPLGAEILRKGGFKAYQGRIEDIQRTYDAQQVAEQTRQRTLSINDWIQNQIDSGYAKNKAEAESQLAEVRSGRYKAFVPSDTDPENVKKGSFVDVWSGFVEQREQAGYTPQELGEIYSGKYKINDIVTTKSQYDKWQNQQTVLGQLRDKGLASDDGYNLADALDTKAIPENQLRDAFGDKAVDEAKIAMALVKAQLVEAEQPPKTWVSVRTGEKITDAEHRALGSSIKVDEYVRDMSSPIAREAMLDIIPIVGTIRYAGRASGDGFTVGEIAWLSTYAALDIVTIAIGFGAAGAGARAAVGAGRMARVAGATRGLGQFALAEIKAPYTMVRHPVQTAKAVYRPFATLIHPRAVPLAAVETSYSTLRVPVRSAGGDADAVRAIREAVTDAAIHGRPAKVTIRGTTVRLPPTVLKTVGSPVAVHTTPDVRPFMTGTVVRPGREGGLYLAPDVHTRFSYASGFGDLPKGGIKGALLIRDERVLKAISPSKKLFRGTAEIEALLPSGTKLPPPSQILFTRDTGGNKLALLVIGKPFTPAQVAKLKWAGALENVHQMFSPAISINRSERGGIKALDEMVDLAKQRIELAKDIERYRKAGDAKRLAKAESSMSRLSKRLDILRPRIQAGLGARTLGRANVLWAQYTDSGVMERWDNITGRRADVTEVNGTIVRRLPGVDARRVGTPPTSLSPRTLGRVALPDEQELRAPPAELREPAIPLTPDIIPPSRPPTEPPTRRMPPRVPSTTITTIRPPTGRPPTEEPPPRVPPRTPPTISPPRVPPRVPPVIPPPRVPPRVPPSRPPVESPPTRIPPRVPPIPRRADVVGKEAKIPPGSVAWRQGAFWKFIPPPYDQPKPITLARGITPMGALKTDLRTTKETIQKIGESDAVVPNRIAADLGVTDLFISNQAQEIDFSGGGEQTNAGVRIPSTTQGMTVNGDGISRPDMTDYKPPSSVSQPHITKTSKEPVRGGDVREIRGKDRTDITERTEDLLEGVEPEPVKPAPKPAPVKKEDDFSDLVELTDEDMSNIFGVDTERDIMGNSKQRKNVNRIRTKRTQPRRGRDIPPTTLRGIEL